MGRRKQKIKKEKKKEKALPSEDVLLKEFQATQDKNEIVEVLKELFREENIRLITELDHDEITLLTRISSIAKMKNISIYDHTIDTYMKLLLSKKRKSRSEIIDAIKGYGDRMRGLSRILPQNWGRR